MSHFAMSSLVRFRAAHQPRRLPTAVMVMLVMAAPPLVAAGPADRPTGSLPGTQAAIKDHVHSGATANYTWQIVTTAEGRTLIASDPTNPVNYIRASMAAYLHGDLTTAVDLLEDGRRNATPSALLLLALGALYAELDRLPAAESTTRTALELEPDNLDGQVQLGEISARAGMYLNAIAAFRGALAVDEDFTHRFIARPGPRRRT